MVTLSGLGTGIDVVDFDGVMNWQCSYDPYCWAPMSGFGSLNSEILVELYTPALQVQ